MEFEDKKQVEEQDIIRLMKERGYSDIQISKVELEKKLTELEGLLADSRNRVKELQVFSKSKIQRWRKKELSYKSILASQTGVLQATKYNYKELVLMALLGQHLRLRFLHSASKKQNVEKESEEDQSSAAKEKGTNKKQSRKSTSNASAKDQGKGKSSKKAKREATKEEMHAVVVDILKKVDFNTATLSDILRQLGTHFDVDLTHRKAEVKAIITDVLNNMSDEDDEGEEAESGDDGEKDEDGDDDA